MSVYEYGKTHTIQQTNRHTQYNRLTDTPSPCFFFLLFNIAASSPLTSESDVLGLGLVDGGNLPLAPGRFPDALQTKHTIKHCNSSQHSKSFFAN